MLILGARVLTTHGAQTFYEHTAAVTCVRFHPDGRTVSRTLVVNFALPFLAFPLPFSAFPCVFTFPCVSTALAVPETVHSSQAVINFHRLCLVLFTAVQCLSLRVSLPFTAFALCVHCRSVPKPGAQTPNRWPAQVWTARPSSGTSGPAGCSSTTVSATLRHCLRCCLSRGRLRARVCAGCVYPRDAGQLIGCQRMTASCGRACVLVSLR